MEEHVIDVSENLTVDDAVKDLLNDKNKYCSIMIFVESNGNIVYTFNFVLNKGVMKSIDEHFDKEMFRLVKLLKIKSITVDKQNLYKIVCY